MYGDSDETKPKIFEPVLQRCVTHVYWVTDACVQQGSAAEQSYRQWRMQHTAHIRRRHPRACSISLHSIPLISRNDGYY